MLDNEIFIVLLYFMLKLCGCGETGRRAGLRNQCLRRGGSSPLIRTNDVYVRTNRAELIKSIRK